jgi:hypothetical protein
MTTNPTTECETGSFTKSMADLNTLISNDISNTEPIVSTTTTSHIDISAQQHQRDQIFNDPETSSLKDELPDLKNINPELKTKSSEFVKNSLHTIIRHAATSELCDPDKQEERKDKISSNVNFGAAVAFNNTTLTFLSNLGKLFPNDIKIPVAMRLIKNYMRKDLTSDTQHVTGKNEKKDDKEKPKPVNIPALLFANHLGKVINLPNNTQSTILTLITDNNELLIDASEQIPLLSDIDIKSKYEVLSKQNKDWVWQTLNQLAMTAAMVSMIEHDRMGYVDDLCNATITKAKKIAKTSHGKMSLKDAGNLISADKDIQKISKKILGSDMCKKEGLADGLPELNGKDGKDTKEEKGSKINAKNMEEYLKETTGKAINISCLADSNGDIDLSDKAIGEMMGKLYQNAEKMRSGSSAKEDAMKDHLRQVLKKRKEKTGNANDTSKNVMTDDMSNNQILDKTVKILSTPDVVNINAGPSSSLSPIDNTSKNKQSHQHKKPSSSSSKKEKKEYDRKSKEEVSKIMKNF